MANENTIAIRITVKDDGSVVLKQFGDNAEKAMGTTGKTTESAGKAFAGLAGQLKTFAAVAGIAFGVNEMVSYARESIMLAARVETLGAVLGVVGENAGYSRGEMQQYVNEVKKMGITTEAAHDAVVKIAQAQINAADSAKLARVAQDAAVIGNINSSEAFSRMINGIRSGEVEILKTIGLQVNFESAYKKTAAALGKSSDALTEREKAQARANVVMEAGTRIEGAYEASMTKAGKAMLSLSRLSEELKLGFGELFGPALTSSVFAITDVLKAWNKEMEEAKASGQWDEMTEMVSGPLKVAWIQISDLTEAVLNFVRPMAPIAGDIASGVGVIAYGWGGVFAALKPIGELLGNQIAIAWELAKILGQTAVMVAAGATGQLDVVRTAYQEAQKSGGTIEALMSRNKALVSEGIADAIAGYGRQAEAAVAPPKRQTEAEKAAQEAISKTRADANAKAAKERDDQAKLDKKSADKRAKLEKDLTKELEKTLAARKKNEGSFYDYKAAEIEVDLQKFRTAGATEAQIARLRKEKLINIELEAAEKRLETEAQLCKTINEYSDESIAAEIAAIEKKYKERARYTNDVTLLLAAQEKEEQAAYSRRDKAVLDYYQQVGRYGQDYDALVESLAIDEYNRVMDLLNDEEEAERAYTEFKQKQSISRVEAEKKASLDRLVSYQALYKDLQGYEGQYYEVSKRIIQERAATELAILNKGLTDFSQIEANERLVAEATTLKLKQLDIEKGKSSDNFIAGMKAQIDEIQLKQIRWGQVGYESFKTMTESMSSTFSTVFEDAYKGDLKSIGDYSTAIWDTVRKKFFDMVAQMITEKIILSFGTNWVEGGTAVLSTINRVLGLADSLDLGQYIGVNFAQGGPVQGYAAYPGNDIRNDKIPAWLSPGEYIMPRTAVNADTKEILDYIRQFGRAPGYALGGLIVEGTNVLSVNSLSAGEPLGGRSWVPTTKVSTSAGDRYYIPQDLIYGGALNELPGDTFAGYWFYPYLRAGAVDYISKLTASQVPQSWVDASVTGKWGGIQSPNIGYYVTPEQYAKIYGGGYWRPGDPVAYGDMQLTASGTYARTSSSHTNPSPNLYYDTEYLWSLDPATGLAKLVESTIQTVIKESSGGLFGLNFGDILQQLNPVRLFTDVLAKNRPAAEIEQLVKMGTMAFISSAATSVFSGLIAAGAGTGGMTGASGVGDAFDIFMTAGEAGGSSFGTAAEVAAAAAAAEKAAMHQLAVNAGETLLKTGLRSLMSGPAGSASDTLTPGSLGFFFAGIEEHEALQTLANLNGIIGMGGKIPSAADGIDYIPRDNTLVNTHKGEAILNADDADEWRSGGGGATVLAELKSLRADLGRFGYYVVKNTNRVAKVVERWDRDGQPAQRVLS